MNSFEETFYPIIEKKWIPFFDEIDENIKKYTFDKYINMLNENKIIYPAFENIFKFTYFFDYNDIDVIILGQDPYINTYRSSLNNEEKIQAQGLAFSVPDDCDKIPPSLINIFKNQLNFNIIKEKNVNGNLERWAKQNVLLLNTSLTVEKSKSNSHKNIWNRLIENIILQISKKRNKLIFLLWGNNALEILKIIPYGHYYVISSHPSPLSVSKKLKDYPAFQDLDHFGIINNLLIYNDKKPIDW
jgi:uracil-DNA glycosylase